MSFKIFILQLTGKIKPVEKIEVLREKLHHDYLQYIQVDQSDELSEFNELDEFVHSDALKRRKAEIQALHFKGSKEYNQLREFEKLKNSKQLKQYFKTEGSEDFNRYLALKDSKIIGEYRALLDFMEKGDYRKEKEEVKLQVFKGSSEQKKLAEFNKLQRLPGIKAYFELHGSDVLSRHNAFYQSQKLKDFFELKNLPEKDKPKKKTLSALKKDTEIKAYLKFEHSKKLKLYHEIIDSYHLKRYEELKAETESVEFKQRVVFLQDKKKFEKTDAFRKWKRYKELASSSDVRFFMKFEKSSLLRNYYDVKDSMELKRFHELRGIVSSDAFRKQREYLEDHKKWEKTEEYAREQKYLEMKKRPHLVNYFKYKGTDAFDFFRTWEMSFEDQFESGHPDRQKWSFMPVWSERLLGKNYSLPGDLHVFTDGRNVSTGGKLVIETRKEKMDGMVWKMPAGFVPGEFDYSSGYLSSGNSFSQEDGIFEAKIKFQPVKEVVSSLTLMGENNASRIHLLEMGTKNRLGFFSGNGRGKGTLNGLDISNLSKGKWYIFTLEKSGGKMTWKINDTEVLSLSQQQTGGPLHIDLYSLVVHPVPGSKLPVRFETDWIRCYKKSSAAGGRDH